ANANPSTNTTSNLTVSAVSIGNSNGTVSSPINSSAASTGYAGASGQMNIGNAARIGSLDVTPSTGSAYFEFTLTPASGYTVSLSAISFGSRSTLTGPVSYSIRTNLDNYNTDYALETQAIPPTSTWVLKTPTLTTITSGVGTSVTVRIYGFGGSGNAGAGTINWRIDDLALTVNVNSASSPALSASPTSLINFNYIQGSGPSTSQSFNLSGSNLLAGSITVTGSANYEVSSDNITFGSTATIPNASGGTLASTPVYVRLISGLNAGSYNNEAISISGGGATASVTASGTVTGSPTVSATPSSLTGFTTSQGVASTAQSFTASGSSLSGNITITAPTDYEISSTSATSGYAGSLILTAVSNSIANTTIWVRIKSTALQGSPSGNVTVAAAGAATQNVAVSGTVNPAPSIISSVTSLSGFTTTQGTASASQSFSVSATNLVDNITVTAPNTSWEVSKDNSAWGATATLTQIGGAVTNAPVYVRISSAAATGSPTGNVTLSSTGATSQTVAVSGTVNPPPAATYNWVGGNGSLATATNWTPSRISPAATDILQFNDGGSATVTSFTSQTIGQLLVLNNTKVTLQSSAAATLTISGNAGDDLVVESGSQLNLISDSAITISLSAGATASIGGNMTLNGSTSATAHKLLAADALSIVFNSPAIITAGTKFSGNMFGNSGTTNVADFKAGTKYIAQGGGNPFALTAPNSKVLFETGSWYVHQLTGTPSTSGRTYANFEFVTSPSSAISSSASTWTVDKLLLSTGSVNYTASGGLVIKGDLEIQSGQTFTYNSASNLKFNGASAQTVFGSGSFTVSGSTLELDNTAGLSLQLAAAPVAVILTNGSISLTNNDLTTVSISGYSTSKYIKTTGTGSLKLSAVGASTKIFPVGKSTYNPVTIANGDNLTWSVRVADAVTGVQSPYNTTKAIQRMWTITPSGTSTGATLTFQYDDSDPSQVGTSYNSLSANNIWHYDGSAWTLAGMGNQTPGPAGVKVDTLSNWTRFSSFAISNANGPLPVHFTSLKAKQVSGGIQVDFTNATETEVVRYEIERSATASSFVTIATLAPSKNDGSNVNYTVVDRVPNAVNYYRVKAIEISGKVTYSNIAKISIGDGAPVGIYPNPVKNGELTVQLNNLAATSYSIRIYNAAGQMISNQVIKHNGGSATESIALPNAKAGLYTITISGGDTQINKTFIVQ
ncbi:MAG: hypothetical protein C4330_11550, partial [Chitinophagaceae bacterium]